MIKHILALVLAITLSLCCCGCHDKTSEDDEMFFFNKDITLTYDSKNQSIANPFMGFAPAATSKNAANQTQLVYVDITFKELMPNNENECDFKKIEDENNLAMWKKEGKHVVFRFICDDPTDVPHRDIPDWLYDKIGGDGTNYDINYGKGFSPNYNNKIFIEYHEKAIKALGEHFGKDNFFSYVELGSLGHWGEWHVNYETGIGRIPKASVRELYIKPYVSAFPNAKILMRRPFEAALVNGFGLFNDMAGDPESTDEWLEWIEDGGDFNQAEEKNALAPMPDAWKNSPIGGEMTSSLAMDYMLKTKLDQTCELTSKSHTTFLGPKCPITSSNKFEDDKLYQNGKDKLLLSMGYKISLKRLEISKENSDGMVQIDLLWTNLGVAPLYFKLPVYIYILDSNNNVLLTTPVDFDLTKLLPTSTIKSSTKLSLKSVTNKNKICVGIVDTMTGKPAVILDNDFELIDNMNQIYKYE